MEKGERRRVATNDASLVRREKLTLQLAPPRLLDGAETGLTPPIVFDPPVQYLPRSLGQREAAANVAKKNRRGEWASSGAECQTTNTFLALAEILRYS